MIDEVETYPELLAALLTFEPPVHIFGGFAEDALLHGRTQRPHDDVDVLVGRHELDVQVENARRLGFGPFESRFEPVAGRPLALGATMASLDLEFGVYDLTEDGMVSFAMTDDEGRPARIYLSDGVLDASLAMLDGVALRTVSPLALYQIRAGITIVGGFGPPRPKDLLAQEALRERFFPTADPESLMPLVR